MQSVVLSKKEALVLHRVFCSQAFPAVSLVRGWCVRPAWTEWGSPVLGQPERGGIVISSELIHFSVSVSVISQSVASSRYGCAHGYDYNNSKSK